MAKFKVGQIVIVSWSVGKGFYKAGTIVELPEGYSNVYQVNISGYSSPVRCLHSEISEAPPLFNHKISRFYA